MTTAMTHDDEAYGLLRAEFGDSVTGPHSWEGAAVGSDSWVHVETDKLPAVALFLRDDARLSFGYLNDLTVVDYFVTDKKFAAAIGEPRLVLAYHLSSLSRYKRLTLKTTVPRSVDGGLPEVPSLAAVWKTAEWQECEAYDLSGVSFTGHPHLRRMLCPDDWVGHPLRKDYTMPLEYDGIRGR